MKDKLVGTKEYYHKEKLKKGNFMELHTYRYDLIRQQDVNNKKIAVLFQKQREIQRENCSLGHKISEADKRAEIVLRKEK